MRFACQKLSIGNLGAVDIHRIHKSCNRRIAIEIGGLALAPEPSTMQLSEGIGALR